VDGATPAKKRIIFLISDTGGGHRSAATAIVEAANVLYPGRFDCKIIDFLRDYYPFPFRYAPEIYPSLEKLGAWGPTFKMLDGKGRAVAAVQLTYPLMRNGIRRLLEENPSDLIVSVHPLVNSTLPKAMRHKPEPFITVVTDMVSVHALWYDRHADLVVVPTELAKQRALRFGVPEGNLRVVGLPVAEAFRHLPADSAPFRADHGWDPDLPVALLVGGGDGMGPLRRVAKAINKRQLPLTLAVVCGRNAELKADLEAVDWKIPTHLYGFTDQMPQFMAASDILITKAGPGTISEAFIAKLPLVLFSRVPGQEDGNVDYVCDHGAGVWAPHPGDVADALEDWLANPAKLAAARNASAALARPDSSRQIAAIIAAHLGVRD
jgi:1,2-diacylglycerol 3-beta-galactosyltransferase